MRKDGFTLVELAIVLVIIGLLIGGILAARSMISTANVTAQITQIQQMDIAIANFKTKYNSLPGDSKIFTPAGDGDGYIESSDNNGALNASLSKFDYEVANFWRHLSLNGYQPENVIYGNDGSGGVRAKVQVPGAKINSNTQVVQFTSPDTVVPNFFPAYLLCDFSKTTTSDLSTVSAGILASITPSDALAIDSKIDDGIPRVATMSAYTGKVFAYSQFPSCYTGSLAYNTSLSSKQCCIAISIGTQSEGRN